MPHPTLRCTPPRPRFDHGQPISAIDARPILVVVILVAVLFLLAASQTRQHALLVDVQQPEAGLIRTGLPPVIHRIGVTASGDLRFDGTAVTDRELDVVLGYVRTLEPRAVLAFEPDGQASYDRSAQTLAMINRAGLIDEWFCINGLEKHQGFGRSSGHPLPILMTPVASDWIRPPPRPIPVLPEIDTCAP